MNKTRNSDLLEQLETSFKEWKLKAGFKANFEELEEIFFIKDYILVSGFVSPKINRMICSRIRDTYMSWINQIHSLLVPNPYSLISTSESQLFDEKEKEELKIIMKEFLALVSLNYEVGITKDYKKEAEFVDKAVHLWKKHLPFFIKYSVKIREYWEK